MKDYKEKYEQALDDLMKIKNANKDNKELVDFIEHKYPELKESKDEKIRKEIRDFICWAVDRGSITEEQREQSNFWLTWLEKQDKENITNKVETKFKIGDWITDGGNTFQIIKIKNEYYIADDEDKVFVKLIDNNKHYHLWTIQDAKDGDVLCDYIKEHNNPLIFILKKFEHVNFGFVIPSDYSSYCFLTSSDKQRFEEGTYHHKHNIKPATKEQRDLLFQKMKEAGYEWDTEKKELKKLVDNDEYHAIPLYKSEKELEQLKQIEQKPTWSEEDENLLKLSLDNLTELMNRFGEKYGKVGDCIDWLKSLKNKLMQL